MKLFIGGLDYRTTEADLDAFFAAHKITLLSSLVAKDKDQMSRCFGFVVVADIDVDGALKLDGKFIGGKKMKVQKAGTSEKKKPQTKKTAKGQPQRSLFDAPGKRSTS